MAVVFVVFALSALLMIVIKRNLPVTPASSRVVSRPVPVPGDAKAAPEPDHFSLWESDLQQTSDLRNLR